MTLYCAIDLHSNNNVPIVIDDDEKVLFSKRPYFFLSSVVEELVGKPQGCDSFRKPN